ncbi:Nif3-like dinuclear metal center hexameric protein [candidate division KSB1 bacterium]|nr:Nif3-like dinuclear metal center hexameric protein [candidate division KSB1 bacterium]RQW00403.1 MAG: Nif3-like dinuclear metal center hexameric protein [candidate division KSB1 bacterium]
MVERNKIVSYVNEYLQIADFKDYGPQGVQVEGKKEVKKIFTGVSASAQLFEKAADQHADMIIVHHGILWNREMPIIKGGYKRRLSTLLHNDITLLAYHLPLDKHPEIGNNALAARAFGLTDLTEFAEVGWMGDISLCSFDVLLKKVRDLYKSDPLVFAYGPEQVSRIGICSGGAQRAISEAIEHGLDVYITGEAAEPTMHLAKEAGIHFISAGHYATERLGVRALGDHLAEKFDVQVEFIDIPNPV